MIKCKISFDAMEELFTKEEINSLKYNLEELFSHKELISYDSGRIVIPKRNCLWVRSSIWLHDKVPYNVKVLKIGNLNSENEIVDFFTRYFDLNIRDLRNHVYKLPSICDVDQSYRKLPIDEIPYIKKDTIVTNNGEVFTVEEMMSFPKIDTIQDTVFLDRF